MSIACTAPFQPLNSTSLREQLQSWNLLEDLAVRQETDGKISVYALEGAQSWPYEWTPNGDDLFEEFEIAGFLARVAQTGQSIRTQDSGGSRVIYVSAR